MRELEIGSDGIYRIPASSMLFSVSRRVLPDAVAPLPAPSAMNPPFFAEAVLDGDASYDLEAHQADGAPQIAITFRGAAAEGVPQVGSTFRVVGAESAEGKEGAPSSFGWMAGALPAPDRTGRYLVEFVGKNGVRPLAYYDRAGHVYETDRALTALPANVPVLSLARFVEESTSEIERGCVEVMLGGDEERRVALYRRDQGRYSLLDSWYAFGSFGESLSYDDLVARCYFAFVYRPARGGVLPPGCALEPISAHLSSKPLVKALHDIVADVDAALVDPALAPPVLARLLALWLDESGVRELSDEDMDVLRLVRTRRYADLYFIGKAEDASPRTPDTVVLRLESALNRYKLIADKLGDDAAHADAALVAHLESTVLDEVAGALPVLDSGAQPGAFSGAPSPPSMPSDGASRSGAPSLEDGLPLLDAALGEWGARRSLAAAVENLRSPLRVVLDFRIDLQRGVAELAADVPDARMMPASVPAAGPDAGARRVLSAAERERAARRFALLLGVASAAEAFASSPRIGRVEFTGRFPGWEGEGVALGAGTLEATGESICLCRVSFDRKGFIDQGAYREVARDPEGFWRRFGGWWAREESELADCDALAVKDVLAAAPCSARDRSGKARAFDGVPANPLPPRALDVPELDDGLLPVGVRAVLGADFARDMRIRYGAGHRRQAERIADAVARCGGDAAAMRAVQTARDGASDPFALEACARVMTALARGELDRYDQNAVVNCYLGEDAYLNALVAAREQFGSDPDGALDTIAGVVADAESRGLFVDDAEVVHRGFDSYGARLLYNLARTGTLFADDPSFGAQDAGKRVELVPDTLCLCYLEAERLMERSFSRTDDAIAYGKRAIELAPTVVAGYRQLARAYMLVGDMASARPALERALRIALLPGDVSLVYYQLAYVLWKSGLPQEGALCYLKSLAVSPFVAPQAVAELRELIQENEVELVEGDALDEALLRAGIAVAPSDTVLEAVLEAAAASADVGMLQCARNLLTSYLRYRPDDALSNVARSLADDRP